MTRQLWSYGCILGVLATACGSPPPSQGPAGESGRNSVVRFIPEPAGAHCAQGGTAIQSGLDSNRNGTLEDSEVSNTAYACNGTSGGPGSRTLLRMDPEPAGSHCPNGGTAVKSGLDANGNNTLEDSEVASTAYVCNGTQGAPGGAGTPGTPGTRSLVRLDTEPVGTNCANGGTAVRGGLDTNANGTLEDSEVTSTSYACNGAQGTAGTRALIRLDTEPTGANCANGGTAVKSGLDSNANGTLEDSEVSDTRYVCSAASLYPTKWAATPPTSYYSGYVPATVWHPVGRKVSIYKTSNTSRLKVTVSDNLLVGSGANSSAGYYAVRMNGGSMSPNCHQGQHNWNAAGWANTYYFPFATVCLSDVLPAGLYEFDAWVYGSNGTTAAGAGTGAQPLLLVEEVPANAAYAASTAGTFFITSSTAFLQAPGRTVTYTKQSAGSLLKVTLADTLRVGYNQSGGSGSVMVRMDGVDTSCFLSKYDAQGAGGDFHNPFVMTCILPNVVAGQHTFTVWLRASSAGETYLGWERTYPLLLVEEVPNQNLSFSNGSSASGELSGNWAGVGTRQVLHTVSATGKTVRVTFSDTFRSAYACNGKWGLYQLYVDNQPTSCINGQYAYNAGATQDHHHPVNHVCMVRGLSSGPHTFAIWSTTVQSDGSSCGSNYFGWNRGQNLLLVEEMP